MKVELFPFQKRGLADLRMKVGEAIGGYNRTHSNQVISFTAPTGAGKTIIMASLIESIYYGNKLNTKPQIRAFVIGDSIDSAISKFKTQEDFGKLYAYTYDQLVRTAEKRFFNLKSKLEEHYNQFAGEDYVKVILNEPEQLRLPGL